MDTLTPALVCQHTWIRLTTTAPTTFADLTGHLTRIVAAASVQTGLLNVQTCHTTTGIVVNGHAHCRALLLPTTVCLNVVDGRLALGRWQRVFLVDLDGPRAREVSVVLTGAVR